MPSRQMYSCSAASFGRLCTGKMIYFLFGEMGSGKSWLAERLAEEMDITYLEGDHSLPSYLIDKIQGRRILTVDEVEDFVRHYLIPDIQKALVTGDLVVSQALYRREHRQIIERAIDEPIIWVCVRPPRS